MTPRELMRSIATDVTGWFLLTGLSIYAGGTMLLWLGEVSASAGPDGAIESWGLLVNRWLWHWPPATVLTFVVFAIGISDLQRRRADLIDQEDE